MEIMQNAECRMQNEQKDSGYRVQQTEVGGQRSEVSGQWAVDHPEGARQRESASDFNHTSSFILHPSSLIFHPSRRGISLLEVLIAIGVLLFGLLGVAALIPLG